MPGDGAVLAATFVEPRGMIRSVVASVVGRELLGAVGQVAASSAAAASTPEASPLVRGQIAYLSVASDQVRLCRAKRGAFRPKPTDDVIASAPRSAVRTAGVEKGRIAGVLMVSFTDGSSWAFDVPKVHLAGAQKIAELLSAAQDA